jgi:hypothetical protein
MAKILEQFDIDRTLKSFDAISKLKSNYLRIFYHECEFDLVRKSELMKCLNKFLEVTPKTEVQVKFLKQCSELKLRLLTK